MIEGIRRKPYIDMVPYIDADKLHGLFLPIAKGIAQAGPLPTTLFPPGTKNRNYTDLNSIPDINPTFIDEYNSTLAGLTLQQQHRFAELAGGMISSGNYIELRYPASRKYKDIFDCELCQDNLAEQALFPELMEFIKTLPFSSIGRIIIFISSPFIEGHIHSDLSSTQEFLFPPLLNKYAYKNNNFIWFNPNNKKKFFIYDEDNDSKISVNSEACFFNTWDYHGSDISTTTTFSFRIDGRFTKELKLKLKL